MKKIILIIGMIFLSWCSENSKYKIVTPTPEEIKEVWRNCEAVWLQAMVYRWIYSTIIVECFWEKIVKTNPNNNE